MTYDLPLSQVTIEIYGPSIYTLIVSVLLLLPPEAFKLAGHFERRTGEKIGSRVAALGLSSLIFRLYLKMCVLSLLCLISHLSAAAKEDDSLTLGSTHTLG